MPPFQSSASSVICPNHEKRQKSPKSLKRAKKKPSHYQPVLKDHADHPPHLQLLFHQLGSKRRALSELLVALLLPSRDLRGNQSPAHWEGVKLVTTRYHSIEYHIHIQTIRGWGKICCQNKHTTHQHLYSLIP